jgi:hypothetical protein
VKWLVGIDQQLGSAVECPERDGYLGAARRDGRAHVGFERG